MENEVVHSGVRRLIFLAAALFIVSLIMTSFNAYVTLAAPPQVLSVPTLVGFEGQLANAAGQPVANGSYNITFSLYTASSGGTALWSETKSVTVTNGLYSVQLGSTNNSQFLGAFDSAQYLGVQVSGDSEMSPRIPLSSVPFALNARQAAGLQGVNVSGTTPTNGQSLMFDGTQWAPSLALPTGAIIMMDSGTGCPTGFAEVTDARGRTIVGVPAGGDIGANALVGTALTNEQLRSITEVPAHTHAPGTLGTGSAGAHTHDIYSGPGGSTWTFYASLGNGNSDPIGGATTSSGAHTHTITGSTASTGSASVDVTMPYIQLRLCKKQ
jgi:hypothetical protein